MVMAIAMGRGIQSAALARQHDQCQTSSKALLSCAVRRRGRANGGRTPSEVNSPSKRQGGPAAAGEMLSAICEMRMGETKILPRALSGRGHCRR